MNGLAVPATCTTFATRMSQGKKDTIKTRIISTVFTMLALAVFKPFGLETWQWMAYVHLLVIGALGIGSCFITEGILKYFVKKPRFQLINSPLVALLICLYRHFAMSDLVPGNVLSWSNFFETLLIIAFCSFAIGLYWRFKYRSKYLTAELEETRQLNEQLQHLQQEAEQRALLAAQAVVPSESEHQEQPSASSTQLPQTTSETVKVHIHDLLYIEAVGNYVKIYQLSAGQVRTDMLRATSKQIEDDLRDYPMIIRCHRAFLVNLQQVEQIVSRAGSMQLTIKHCQDSLPVSRSHMAGIKETINGK